MSYKIVKSVVGGRVIEERWPGNTTGYGINTPVKIEKLTIYDTGVKDFTGFATFMAGDYVAPTDDNPDPDINYNHTCIIPFYKVGGAFTLGSASVGTIAPGASPGSLIFTTTLDHKHDSDDSDSDTTLNATTESINIYIDSGELKIQNNIPTKDIYIYARF